MPRSCLWNLPCLSWVTTWGAAWVSHLVCFFSFPFFSFFLAFCVCVLMCFLLPFFWQTFALENDFESFAQDCMRVLVANSDEALGVGVFCGSGDSDEPTLQKLGRVSSEAMAAYLQQPEVALSDEYEVWQGLLRWARLFFFLLSSVLFLFSFLFFISLS